jgi:hypothetical protein
MRLKNFVCVSILAGFLATLSVGCSSDVPVTPAPEPAKVPIMEISKDPKKGGGPASSGNLKRNPMEDKLAPK